MTGYYRMHRGWMENPVFQDEPFSERTAWVWMIEETAWKPVKRRVGGVVVEIERGQLAASVRYLAETWGWHRSRVERFLGRLTDESMIETAAGQGVTVITLCNYDKYQSERDTDDMQSETAARQQRDSSETIYKEKEVKEVKEVKDISRELVLEFDEFWKVCPLKRSKGQALTAFKRARKSAELTALIDGMVRYAAETAGQDPQFVKHPSTWLNGQCWLDEAKPSPPALAKQTAPSATGGVADSEKVAALVRQSFRWVQTPEGMKRERVA